MEGWSVRPLEDLCEFRNGLWKGKKAPYVHVGVIRNTNFTKSGFLDDQDIAYLDVEEKQFAKRQLQFGDLILEKSGGGPKQPVGRVITFEKTEGLFSFSNFTSVIRVVDPSVLSFQFLHRFLYWQYISGVTEGMQRRSTGIRNLDFTAYKQLSIPLPPPPRAGADRGDPRRGVRGDRDGDRQRREEPRQCAGVV
ncbi:restriction endonuclease subunit S [bacterium]|nr:restriction endonuclease subunit S [bacterium]